MTKEEAYERLELEVGVDLNVVRQKFASMHNDYRMQIDNAFNPTSKRIFEQKLEELKEAYAVLNESKGIDDNASLPRTSIELDVSHDYPEEEQLDQAEMSLDDALNLFGLHHEYDVNVVIKIVSNHLNELRVQLENAKIVSVKNAYQIEIEKAEKAKLIISEWLEEKRILQVEHTIPNPEQIPEITETANESKWWSYFVKAVLVVSLLIFFVQITVGSGRLIGAFASSFYWVLATIISSAVILNTYSNRLVPDFLKSNLLKGRKGIVSAIAILFLGMAFAALMFKIGSIRENNPWIKWDYYIDIAFYALLLLLIIWLVILITALCVGLISPKTLFFESKSNVVLSFLLIIVYQVILVVSLQWGAVLVDLNREESEDPYLGLLDTVYDDGIPDSTVYDEIERLTKLANEGDAESQFWLGYKYSIGEIVEKDQEKSIYWYRKSADQNYADAQVELAWIYDHGEGLKKDEKKAHQLYLKAAEQGNPAGQYYVGWNYIYGVGVSIDKQVGIAWLKKSANQGYEEAIAELKKNGISDY